MIIERFTVSDSHNEKGDIISWMPGLPSGTFWNTFRGNPDGLAIPSNEEIIMLQLLGDSNDRRFSEFREQVRKTLGKLTVRVKYKDIYGRPMPVEERALTWFARHF